MTDTLIKTNYIAPDYIYTVDPMRLMAMRAIILYCQVKEGLHITLEALEKPDPKHKNYFVIINDESTKNTLAFGVGIPHEHFLPVQEKDQVIMAVIHTILLEHGGATDRGQKFTEFFKNKREQGLLAVFSSLIVLCKPVDED
jgi:hypothetical protein